MMIHALHIQKSNLGDTKLFDILELAMNHLQDKKKKKKNEQI